MHKELKILRDNESETYSLVEYGGSLSELDCLYIAPGALHTQHLTVNQPDQELTHLTLFD